jgi:integrase/recombinase XerD
LQDSAILLTDSQIAQHACTLVYVGIPAILQAWQLALEERNVSPHTLSSYTSDLRTLVRYLKPIALEGATPADLDRYCQSLFDRGLSPSTRGRRIAAIKNFYEWRRRSLGQTSSVAHDLRPPRRDAPVHRWWTAEQVQRFREGFALFTATDFRDRAICELGLMGLRVEEVTTLNVEHIIHVTDPVTSQVIIMRKGRKEQVLPLTESARKALSNWLLARQRLTTPALFCRLPFQGARPRLTRFGVERIFKEYAQRAGLPLPPRKAFHHLRHTTGQRMADLGIPIEEAQAILGHADPSTTQMYYRVSDRRLRDAARRLRYE